MDVGDCGAGLQEGDVGWWVHVRMDVDDGGGHCMGWLVVAQEDQEPWKI